MKLWLVIAGVVARITWIVSSKLRAIYELLGAHNWLFLNWLDWDFAHASVSARIFYKIISAIHRAVSILHSAHWHALEIEGIQALQRNQILSWLVSVQVLEVDWLSVDC